MDRLEFENTTCVSDQNNPIAEQFYHAKKETESKAARTPPKDKPPVPCGADSAGYMALRDEFDVEWDNEAEMPLGLLPPPPPTPTPVQRRCNCLCALI